MTSAAGGALRRGLGIVWATHRLALCLLVAVAVGQAAVLSATVLLGTSALRTALAGGGLWRLGITLALAGVAQTVLSEASHATGTLLRQQVGVEVSARALARLREVPFEQVEDNEWQGSVGLVLRQAAYRPGFLVDNFVSLVQAAAAVIGVLAGAVRILGPILLVLPVAVLPVLALEARLRRRLLTVQTSSAPDQMRMQFLAQASIDSDWQRDVRVYGSDVIATEYSRLSRRYLGLLRATVRSTSVWRAGAGAVLACLVVGLAGLPLMGGNLDTTRVTVLFGVLLVTAGYLRSLVSSSGELSESAQYLSILFGVLDAGSAPGTARGPAEAGGQAVPAGERLVLTDVGYTYPGRSAAAVSGVSLDLGPGLTALTGPNGAGKTTLVKLLAGLIEPGHGTVTVPAGLTRAVLFQNAAHLRLTVRQNVALGQTEGEPDDEVIWRLLDEVGLASVVKDLPRGLDSVVGAGFGGESDLSGGQWQRLAVARLLYADAGLIICDEPATGLDADGEARLLAQLAELAGMRIVLIVTHRQETMERCQRVITLVDGQVVGDSATTPGLPWVAAAGDPSRG